MINIIGAHPLIILIFLSSPVLASQLEFKQIFETKTLLENVFSPSRDQLAIFYKQGVELERLNIHIYNISGNNLISHKNQTIYADAPKKIFWLHIDYFLVITLPENSNYEIIFFKVGKTHTEARAIFEASIVWNDWSAVFSEDA